MPLPTPNDPAERKTRQLAQSREVQELTMRLIRKSAARAEQALDAPAPTPDPEAPRARTPDPVLEFVRLTRALNQTMVIENRIANDDFAPKIRYRSTQSAPTPARNDPRRPLLRQACYQATQRHPDRARRRREIEESIDHHLAADPDQTLQAIDILQAVSEEIDLPIDPAELSDEILGMPPRNFAPPPPPDKESG